MKYINPLVLCLMFFNNVLVHATVVVQGNDSNPPFTFLTPVTAKVLDPRTGCFYVGIENGSSTATQSGTYTISKTTRPDFEKVLSFTGIATSTDPNLQNQTVEFLTLSPQCNSAPFVITVLLNGSESFTQSQVIALTSDGNTAVPSGSLNDADENTTGGIVGLEANSCFIFTPVRPSSVCFGEEGSGVALTCIVTDCDDNLSSLQIKDATTGLDGNKAQRLQNDSVQFTGGTDSVEFSVTTTDKNKVATHYDPCLDRLYLGVRIGQTNLDGIAKGVVVGYVDCCNILQLVEIVENNAININENQIVVTRNVGQDTNLSIKFIRTMRASTGPNYLIVNGGNGTTEEVGNLVFAMPLVNDPCNPTKHGTLANKNQALQDGKFTEPATTDDQLAINTDPPAMVGAGPLPILPDQEISDMVVVGDAVYVSINLCPSEENDTGVLYSQAIFDKTGKILRWTPWTKRAAPFLAFDCDQIPGCVRHTGAIKLFDVDAKTGHMWLVEGNTGRTVGTTSWCKCNCPCDLVPQINERICCKPVYSVLDLDQSTRGFVDPVLTTTTSRYALFGSAGKVVFTRISRPVDNVSLDSPQTVITNFCCPENLLVTDVERCPCVEVLEYSRRTTDEGNQNYFFAGGQQGFFVFTNADNEGFNVADLNCLDMSPFSDRRWKRISTIPGSIVDIKTSGVGNLYVLTLQINIDGTSPFTNKLLSIPFQDTADDMFATNNIYTIAQTGHDSFANIAQMYGMQIIATGDPETSDADQKEQLVLGTNQGLFRSNADQMGAATGIPDAMNDNEAQWEIIPGTECDMFNGIAGMDTPIRHTVWPFSIKDCRCNTFEAGSIHQLSGNGTPSDDGDTACFDGFVPANFNVCAPDCNFCALYPINNFFSDGGRRFFIFNRPCDSPCTNKLSVIPFDNCKWNLDCPRILDDPCIQKVCRFYWVRTIGMSGLVMAGTDSGVIAIQ